MTQQNSGTSSWSRQEATESAPMPDVGVAGDEARPVDLSVGMVREPTPGIEKVERRVFYGVLMGVVGVLVVALLLVALGPWIALGGAAGYAVVWAIVTRLIKRLDRPVERN